jgi:hypothetical protein
MQNSSWCLSHAPVIYLVFTSQLSILVSQILGLVENMSCFKCPKCGEKSYIFGEGGAQRTAEEMDMKLLGDVSESCDCNWHQFLSYDEYARMFYIWEKVESFSSIRLQFLDIMNVRRREHSVSNEHPKFGFTADGWLTYRFSMFIHVLMILCYTAVVFLQ